MFTPLSASDLLHIVIDIRRVYTAIGARLFTLEPEFDVALKQPFSGLKTPFPEYSGLFKPTAPNSPLPDSHSVELAFSHGNSPLHWLYPTTKHSRIMCMY